MLLSRLRPYERLTAGYLTITGVLVVICGRPWAHWWPVIAAHFIAVVFLVTVLPRLQSNGWPSVVRDWVLVAAIPILYGEIAQLNQLVSPGYHDSAIQSIELAVFQVPPRVTLRALFPWRPLVEYLHFCYVAYYALLPVLGCVLYLRGKRREFRFVLSAVLTVFYACYLCFIFFPVAGPWYRIPHPDLASLGMFFPTLVHRLLVHGASKGAAFPSSHVAVAVVIWLLAWRFARPVFWLFAAIVPAMALGTVYGGFHYATDVAAGAVVGIVGYYTAPYLYRLLGGESLDPIRDRMPAPEVALVDDAMPSSPREVRVASGGRLTPRG